MFTLHDHQDYSCTIYLRFSAIWLLEWSYIGRNLVARPVWPQPKRSVTFSLLLHCTIRQSGVGAESLWLGSRGSRRTRRKWVRWRTTLSYVDCQCDASSRPCAGTTCVDRCDRRMAWILCVCDCEWWGSTTGWTTCRSVGTCTASHLQYQTTNLYQTVGRWCTASHLYQTVARSRNAHATGGSTVQINEGCWNFCHSVGLLICKKICWIGDTSFAQWWSCLIFR